jgi:hypothetical protein
LDEVTAVEAAALTGLSERTIRRRIAAGTLHARRISANRFAIHVDDLPQRKGLDALLARIDALERRVQALESLRGVSSVPRIPLPAGAEGTRGAEAIPLKDLLDQLVHEVDRITPLLSPGGIDTSSGSADAPALRVRRRGRSRTV